MKIIAKQIGILLLASAVLAGVSNLFHPRRIPWLKDWSELVKETAENQRLDVISFPAAQALFDEKSATFVDARPAAEYAKGHIPGAVSVPFEELDDSFPVIFELMGSGEQLVIYCSNRECDIGLLLATELHENMGYSNVVLFVDGFYDWLENGGEVAQ